MEPQVGSILEGKVTSITKFGAFVAVEGGRSGLVHISEIANTYVNDVRDYLQEGQTVRVVVLPAANGKLNFSIKRALPQQPRSPQSRPAPGRAPARPAESVPRREAPPAREGAAHRGRRPGGGPERPACPGRAGPAGGPAGGRGPADAAPLRGQVL